MKKTTITLAIVALALALPGCGGGGSDISFETDVESPFVGIWAGSVSGSLDGTATVSIGADGTFSVTATIDRIGTVTGSGKLDLRSGRLLGELNTLGQIEGVLWLDGGVLVGEARVAGVSVVRFRLTE